MKIGALTFFLHLGLNFALRAPMAHDGIALSTSLSAFADSILLAWLLRRRVGEYIDRRVTLSALRTLAAAGVMAAALWLAMARLDPLALPGIAAKAAVLGALIAGGGAIFLATSVVLGSEEVLLLRSVIAGRA